MGELEMAAVVFGLTNVKHFTYLVQDMKIFSDHSPLVGLSHKSLDDIDNPRLTALFDKISNYSFPMHHIHGKENRPPGVLSRLGHDSCDFPEVPYHVPIRSVNIVQTRGSSIQIAKDLIDISV